MIRLVAFIASIVLWLIFAFGVVVVGRAVAYEGAVGDPPTALARCGGSDQPATAYTETDQIDATAWEQRQQQRQLWAVCWTTREVLDDLAEALHYDPAGEQPDATVAQLLTRIANRQDDIHGQLQQIAQNTTPAAGSPTPATVQIDGVDPDALGTKAEAAINDLNATLWWLAGAIVASVAAWALLRQVMPR